MVDSRVTMDRAEEVLERIRSRTTPRAIKAHRRRVVGFFRRLKYAFFAVLGVALAGGLIGSFVTPLGIWGFFLMLVAMAIVFFGILGWPQAPEPTPQQMAKSELPLLPSQTERWLEAQRPALPAPAQQLPPSRPHCAQSTQRHPRLPPPATQPSPRRCRWMRR